MAVLDGVSDSGDPSLPFMLIMSQPMDFTCVETQVGDGAPIDCEIVSLEEQPQKYAAKVTQQ